MDDLMAVALQQIVSCDEKTVPRSSSSFNDGHETIERSENDNDVGRNYRRRSSFSQLRESILLTVQRRNKNSKKNDKSENMRHLRVPVYKPREKGDCKGNRSCCATADKVTGNQSNIQKSGDRDMSLNLKEERDQTEICSTSLKCEFQKTSAFRDCSSKGNESSTSPDVKCSQVNILSKVRNGQKCTERRDIRNWNTSNTPKIQIFPKNGEVSKGIGFVKSENSFLNHAELLKVESERITKKRSQSVPDIFGNKLLNSIYNTDKQNYSNFNHFQNESNEHEGEKASSSDHKNENEFVNLCSSNPVLSENHSTYSFSPPASNILSMLPGKMISLNTKVKPKSDFQSHREDLMGRSLNFDTSRRDSLIMSRNEIRNSNKVRGTTDEIQKECPRPRISTFLNVNVDTLPKQKAENQQIVPSPKQQTTGLSQISKSNQKKMLREYKRRKRSKPIPTYKCLQCERLYAISSKKVAAISKCMFCDLWTSEEPAWMKEEKVTPSYCKVS